MTLNEFHKEWVLIEAVHVYTNIEKTSCSYKISIVEKDALLVRIFVHANLFEHAALILSFVTFLQKYY